MTLYQADKTLENILIKNSFIDITTERNRIKKKRQFKLKKNARKQINFDYINIKVEYSAQVYDSKITLSEEDLRLLILYFKLSLPDSKEIFNSNRFSFIEASKRLESLRNELATLELLSLKTRRQNKIKRLLNIYNSLEL